jgi:LPXTG-site transpeptidase (sortase) family protein
LLLFGLTLLWPASPDLAISGSPPSTPTPVEILSSSSEPISIDSQLLSRKSQLPSPQRILIPSIKLDLPITPAQAKNGYWEVSESGASHGLGSSYPGESGNIVVFAHAREGLFLPLRQITKGSSIYLLTDGKWYSYLVKEIITVKPSQIEVIAPTSFEILTLFTCSGFQDSQRLIVQAVPSDLDSNK